MYLDVLVTPIKHVISSPELYNKIVDILCPLDKVAITIYKRRTINKLLLRLGEGNITVTEKFKYLCMSKCSTPFWIRASPAEVLMELAEVEKVKREMTDDEYIYVLDGGTVKKKKYGLGFVQEYHVYVLNEDIRAELDN